MTSTSQVKNDSGNLAEKFKADFCKRIIEIDNDYEAKQLWTDYSGLSTKSFYRYKNAESCPIGNNTIMAYKFILNTMSDKDAFEAMPAHAKELHARAIKSKSAVKKEITEVILKKAIHYRIFTLTMNSNCIDINLLSNNGQDERVVKAFSYLKEHRIIEEVASGLYKRGEVNTNFSAQEVLNLNNYLFREELDADCLDED